MNAESRLLKELKATRLERDRAQAAVAAARLAHREALARVQSLALLSPAPPEADVAAAASAVASAARTVASAEGSVPSYRACPLETDILVFHYVLEGPEGTPYAGGFYHGIIQFPPEYPLKPPSVKMLTPVRACRAVLQCPAPCTACALTTPCTTPTLLSPTLSHRAAALRSTSAFASPCLTITCVEPSGALWGGMLLRLPAASPTHTRLHSPLTPYSQSPGSPPGPTTRSWWACCPS